MALMSPSLLHKCPISRRIQIILLQIRQVFWRKGDTWEYPCSCEPLVLWHHTLRHPKSADLVEDAIAYWSHSWATISEAVSFKSGLTLHGLTEELCVTVSLIEYMDPRSDRCRKLCPIFHNSQWDICEHYVSHLWNSAFHNARHSHSLTGEQFLQR